MLFLPSHYQPTVPLQYGPASPSLSYKMSSTTPLEYRDAFVARVRQAGSMRTILNVPLQRSAAWTQVLTATMSVDEAKSRRRQCLCT